MKESSLGRTYRSGETIVRQGEKGDCMYVIQRGKAEVLQEAAGREVSLAVLTDGDVFGEMALFEQHERSATVKALTDVRALTVDKTIFLRRIHQDPSLAFMIMQKMSNRIRELDAEVARIKSQATAPESVAQARETAGRLPR